MDDYPTTLPCPNFGQYKDSTLNPRVFVPFGNGYGESRPKYTRVKKKFELTYSFLKDSEKVVLDNFFSTHQGVPFKFTDPATGGIYTVTFGMDSLDFTKESSVHYSTSAVILEEL